MRNGLWKHRFIEVDKKGDMLKMLPSKTLPFGSIMKGHEILHHNGNTYKVVRVVMDMEVGGDLGEPEMHVELLKLG